MLDIIFYHPKLGVGFARDHSSDRHNLIRAPESFWYKNRICEETYQFILWFFQVYTWRLFL
jgi:hypothetical protein